MADRIMFDGNDCPHTREPSVHGQPDPPYNGTVKTPRLTTTFLLGVE